VLYPYADAEAGAAASTKLVEEATRLALR